MSAETVQTLRYPFASEVYHLGDDPRLRLATCPGDQVSGSFFQGRLSTPDRDCAALLVIGRVAQSRFYVPPGMLQRILREADPVITGDTRTLRFESFSQCCGVHARLDLGPEALDGADIGRGTTNVDFNPPMRAALTSLPALRSGMALSVGAERFEVESDGERWVEKKVALPRRWTKGFVETQAYAARLERRFELGGAELRRLLESVPKTVGATDSAYLVASGRGVRLSQRPGSGAVAVGGIGRLRVLAPLVRFIRRLDIHALPDGAVTGWVADLGGSRLEILLSPTASRGFSGEGQVLEALADNALDGLSEVRARLSWVPQASMSELRTATDLPEPRVAAALAALGTHGLVGYSLAEQAYFKRELPFAKDTVIGLHPRLEAAQALFAAGAVAFEDRGGEPAAFVRSRDTEYLVRREGDGWRCNCPWYIKTAGTAGPCKHVLAVRLALQEREAP